jgi:hypothetical protein
LVIRDVEVRDAIQSLGRREVARKYESVPFVAVSRHADDESASSNVVFNWYDGAELPRSWTVVEVINAPLAAVMSTPAPRSPRDEKSNDIVDDPGSLMVAPKGWPLALSNCAVTAPVASLRVPGPRIVTVLTGMTAPK